MHTASEIEEKIKTSIGVDAKGKPYLTWGTSEILLTMLKEGKKKEMIDFYTTHIGQLEFALKNAKEQLEIWERV